MMRAPSLSAVLAAESKVAASRREVIEGLQRVRAASHLLVARPVSLAIVGGVAAVVGIFIARLIRSRSPGPLAGAAAARVSPLVLFLRASAMKYALPLLPAIVRRIAAGLRKPTRCPDSVR